MIRDYRSYLKAVGRKPIRGPIRTKRRPGDVEIVRDARSGDHVLVRYEEDLEFAGRRG